MFEMVVVTKASSPHPPSAQIFQSEDPGDKIFPSLGDAQVTPEGNFLKMKKQNKLE